MTYGTKYIIGFTNDLNEFYEIYFDVLNYSGQVTHLTGTDDVLTIRCTSGDENKFAPILGSEAVINIYVDETTPISIDDLVATEADEIRVTVFRNENYASSIFQGFIVVEDNFQPFSDPPFVLSVRALDGLGLLKGVDLGDLNNLRYVGRMSVIEWIGQILFKTGQTLNIRAYFNFFESSFNQMQGALEQVYLDAITFSQGDAFNPTPIDPTVDVIASSADDCYTALEKIVRCLRCRLFMENGAWNLVSLYEYLNPNGFSYKEYAFGSVTNGLVAINAVDGNSGQDYSLPIGKDQIVFPISEDQQLYLKVPTKWIKLTYNYDQSQNKICNQDFTEGDRNTTYDEVISSSIIDPTIQPVINLQTQGYDAYCWTHLNGPIGNPVPPTQNGFIRSVVDQYGYENDRFLVLQEASTITFFRSSELLVDAGDKFELSVNFRTRIDKGSQANQPVAYVLFYGDDGTFWTLSSLDSDETHNPTTWVQSNSSFSINIRFVGHTFVNTNSWQQATTGITLPKVPGSGKIVVLLPSNIVGAQEYWFKSLSITIHPYLLGSYIELKGDYNYSASNNNIKQTESDTVEISDSPKRYFKGALLKSNGDLCTPTWARVGIIESYRFTQLMERIMYNHLRRVFQKMEGTFKGLMYVLPSDLSKEIPAGFLNSYLFTDHNVPTKRFMLTSFEKQYHTGQGRLVLVETLSDQNDTGFILPDAYQFNYIFQ